MAPSIGICETGWETCNIFWLNKLVTYSPAARTLSRYFGFFLERILPGSRLFGKLIFPGSRLFGKLIFPGSRALGRLILAGSTGGQSELQRFLKDFNAKRAEGVSKTRVFLSESALF